MSLRCRWSGADGFDNVTVAVGLTQYVGGPRDGKTFARPFRFNLKPLMSLLDRVGGVGWEPFDMVSTPFPSHVWVIGTYHGHTHAARAVGPG